MAPVPCASAKTKEIRNLTSYITSRSQTFFLDGLQQKVRKQTETQRCALPCAAHACPIWILDATNSSPLKPSNPERSPWTTCVLQSPGQIEN